MNQSSDEGHVAFPSACVGLTAAIIARALSGDDGRKSEPMLRGSDADDLRIALHESSHALAGRLLGSPLGGMTCDAGEGFSGLCWGPSHERRSKFSSHDAPSLCAQIGPSMPAPGENRAAVADIVLHCHTRVVELVAGSVGEALFLPGEPWPADSDRAQERAIGSLVCSSPEAIEAFIDFCVAEAAALLRPQEHILRALTNALLIRRTMDGREIDEIISGAVTAKNRAHEIRRRLDWKRIEQSAARFERDRS
jgi:hypothetical protein